MQYTRETLWVCLPPHNPGLNSPEAGWLTKVVRVHYTSREFKEIGTCIVYKKDISCKGGNISMWCST